MRKRLEWRGIDCEVAAVRRDDPLADLSDVDVILIGGGGDNEQLYVCKHLMEYKNELRNYIEDNGSLIAICGGYQLLGNYYKLQNETIKGLEILDIYTEIGKGRLIADAILRLAQNVTDGLLVNEKIVEKTVKEYLPFIATENLMMEAVKKGGDRQKLHEIIRKCSMESTAKMKNGEECDLLSRLAQEKEFGLTETEMNELLTPSLYIGRCSEQVEAFIDKIKPLIADVPRETAEINL